MIWTAEYTAGIYTSGFYRINRDTTCYSLWFTSPKAFGLISRSATLSTAKQDAEQHRKILDSREAT
jgi:hypothetical protein